MQTEPKTLERLKTFFEAAGFRPSDIPKLSCKSPDLAFLDGNENVFVEVAKGSDLDSIMNAVISAGRFAGLANKTYLAIPMAFASLVDSRIFERNGIGLVTYDERRIREVLEAKRNTYINADLTTTKMPELHNEMLLLRDRFSTMEATLENLKAELSLLKTTSQNPPIIESSRHQEAAVVSHENPTGQPGAYFEGNPWVRLLSIRGRDTGGISN